MGPEISKNVLRLLFCEKTKINLVIWYAYAYYCNAHLITGKKAGMENEKREAFNLTLKPTVVQSARKRIEIEKKKKPKMSVSSIVEELLEKWGAKVKQ